MKDGSRRDRRLADPQRAAQHGRAARPGCRVHHGGGVGIGYRCTPGRSSSPTARRRGRARLERVLTNDPGMGVMRHADAGYPEAIEARGERGVRIPMLPG